MKRKTRKSSLVTAPRFQGGSKHDTATKLAAIRDVRQLMLQGIAKWSALSQIAADHNVTDTTMGNWFKKYKDVTVTLPRSNGDIANTLKNDHADRFTLLSVKVRTVDGNEGILTAEDIHGIATLASTIC